MPGRPAIVSGDRADGTQQRLRYGLGEFRPYRYKGRPGWNPARALDAGEDRMRRKCRTCGARAGVPCRTRSGNPVHSGAHSGR